jgi:hypothetical protein
MILFEALDSADSLRIECLVGVDDKASNDGRASLNLGMTLNGT